jgi:hypothetical protein
MSDEAEKPNRQRWGRLEWGTLAFLCYLWGWLIFWGCVRSKLLGPLNLIYWIAYLVYWPFVRLSNLIHGLRH